MNVRRRILTIAFAIVATAACDPAGQARLGPDVRRGLERGRETASSWIQQGRAATPPPPSTVVALGYLERLRLGLGSPFRLIDFAIHDPRLDDSTRVQVGWAILARTLDRNAYQVDDAALDRIGLGGMGSWPTLGRHHFKLIEGAIRESRDPRSGELAVRLAYALASAEGSLPSAAPELAARAAALIRDRELAHDDATRLLHAADTSSSDPLHMVATWRSERRFQVEEPPIGALAPESELSAIEMAPRLAEAIRDLIPRFEELRWAKLRSTSGQSLLGTAAAYALREAADSLRAPAQTPIVIAARMYRKELVEPQWLTEGQRRQRERFVMTATSEERFAAEHALLQRRSPYDVAPALSALAAAVAMRPYAQEQVWYPGYAGPSVRELEERYGLAAVRFGDEVPADWRPYYRRMLDVALADLYRVLPALDLSGLTVTFADHGIKQDATLAMHDPRARKLMLPPATGAGTIAHEVAHDLDWQVALRRYRVRGDYASDRAARSGSDRFAMRVQDLASASLEPYTSSERAAAHGRRPAEIFARNIDWFVAVSLASQGRTNGYLSSVQDDMLTGYGTVRPPDVSGNAADALVTILDEVAPVYPATREWFLKNYGLNRALTPYDLARRVLEAPVDVAADRSARAVPSPMMLTSSTAATALYSAVESAEAAGFASIDAWVCRSPGASYNRGLEAARRRLVVEAAAARARGVAVAQGRTLAGRTGQQWIERELYGPRWPGVEADSLLLPLLASQVEEARHVADVDVTRAARPFDLITPPDHCAAAPFHAF